VPFLNVIERVSVADRPVPRVLRLIGQADLIVPITSASTNTLMNPNKLKKERVLQVLRDANSERSMALLQAVAPHIGVATGSISELRVESHVIETPSSVTSTASRCIV
jgi:hypothetical protein